MTLNSPTLWRKKPLPVEAMQWDGTAEGAAPIIDWILASTGQFASFVETPPRLHSRSCRCDGYGIVPGLDGHAVKCPETKVSGGKPNTIVIRTTAGDLTVLADVWVVVDEGKVLLVTPDAFATMFEQRDA